MYILNLLDNYRADILPYFYPYLYRYLTFTRPLIYSRITLKNKSEEKKTNQILRRYLTDSYILILLDNYRADILSYFYPYLYRYFTCTRTFIYPRITLNKKSKEKKAKHILKRYGQTQNYTNSAYIFKLTLYIQGLH